MHIPVLRRQLISRMTLTAYTMLRSYIRHISLRLARAFAAMAPVIAVAAGLSQPLQAQDVQMTQYWAVPTYYNPAATGNSDYLRIRGAARMQWIGIHNAPRSFLVLADSPLKFGRKQHIGLGLGMVQESLGLFSNLGLNIQASYKLRVLKGTLSIGIQGGYYDQKFKGSEVVVPEGDDYHQSSDEALPTQDLAGHVFDFSLGLEYQHKYFYAGIGAQHLMQPTIKLSMEGSEASEDQEYETELPRMFYFNAGSNIQIKNSLFELQPSLLVRTDLKTFSADITARARYNRFLSFGLAYRYNDAISAMVGVDFKGFFIGYSYDYPLTAIAKASSGSHEVVVGYQLKLDFNGKNRNKHRSIRLM